MTIARAHDKYEHMRGSLLLSAPRAIEVGDAQAGPLTTMCEGAYPDGGYDPMKEEGAIVLGTGGDDSFRAVPDFFEGVMTTGYASDAVDEVAQANIVAAGCGR